MKKPAICDLDGTILQRWTNNDNTPRPAPWLKEILERWRVVAICTNQGGIAFALAGGRPGYNYPSWPQVLNRIEAGMALTGALVTLVALYHPSAHIPQDPAEQKRANQTVGLPLYLLPYNALERPVILSTNRRVVASWSPAWRKPNPTMLKLAMEITGVTDCVYVGDEDSDRDAARKAGIPFVYVREGGLVEEG